MSTLLPGDILEDTLLVMVGGPGGTNKKERRGIALLIPPKRTRKSKRVVELGGGCEIY